MLELEYTYRWCNTAIIIYWIVQLSSVTFYSMNHEYIQLIFNTHIIGPQGGCSAIFQAEWVNLSFAKARV